MNEPRAHPFVVAVSGHRPNRMHIGTAEISRRLEAVLAALRSGAKGRPRVALTPLAEGSDYELHAMLPFERTDYETTFTDNSANSSFRALLDQAAYVTELPGTLADTRAAYEACGRAAVEQSDILVDVWDGKAAAGRGGTPEIIGDAISKKRPVIWIDAARVGPPLLLLRPSRHSMSGAACQTCSGR